MKTNKKKAFTIIELVIVIAVIGILTAILIPTFMGITDKAHATENETFVRNINTQLAIDEAKGGKKNPTMYDAVQSAQTIGFDVEKITPYNGNDIIWDSVNDRFAIVKSDYTTVAAADRESRIVYSDSSFSADTPFHKLWKVYPEMPDTQNYSIYAKEGWALDEPVAASVGFDVGKNSLLAKVNYTHNGTRRDVTIRTNSASTSLSVEGYINPLTPTEGDVIKHYGTAGSLNIIQCATGSYHEYGEIAYAQISKGRIVLENDSEVTTIHINKKVNEESYDDVVIKDNGAKALPDEITRDPVNVAGEKEKVVIVESGNRQETVYAYPDGTLGTTEQTLVQNTDVKSDLGKLVLDNGSESKALDNEKKEEAKKNAVDNAINAETLVDNGNYVCRIETVGYETIQAAIDTIEPNVATEICVLKDLENHYFNSLSNQRISLNLCNHKLTFNAISSAVKPWLYNSGGNKLGQQTACTIFNFSTIELLNGTIESTFPAGWNPPCVISYNSTVTVANMNLINQGAGSANYAFWNIGNARITGETTVSCLNGTAVNNNGGAYLLIDGPKCNVISRGNHAINNANNGRVQVDAGLVRCEDDSRYTYCVNNAGSNSQTTINGGTFETKYGRLFKDTGTTEINGGYFNRIPVEVTGKITFGENLVPVSVGTRLWSMMEKNSGLATIKHAGNDSVINIESLAQLQPVAEGGLLEEGDTINLTRRIYKTSEFDIFDLPNNVSLVGNESIIILDKFENGNGDRLIDNSIAIENVYFIGGFAIEADSTHEISFKNCVFDGQEKKIRDYTSTYYYGLMIFGENEADVVVDNCLFKGYPNSDGRSIDVDQSTKEFTLTIKNCPVFEDVVYGMHVDTAPLLNLVIDNCDINDWTAFGATKTLTITNSRFGVAYDDTITRGANRFNLRFYSDATLTNCTFGEFFEEVDVNSDQVTVTFVDCEGLTPEQLNAQGHTDILFVLNGTEYPISE